jgi:hypothetical protein
VVPKWALRSLDVQGPVTVSVREEAAEQQQVSKSRNFKVVLDDGLCQTCNNVRLSQLENAVKPILAPMAVERRPTTLTPARQKLLATWAVKTVFLLELAIRQKYPGTRPVEGYLATAPEMAWMFAKLEPPPRSMVWLGCWDCQQEVPVNYAPSSAPLPTTDGKPVEGHFATFTLGNVAFQAFTVDFIAADQHGADLWNTHPPSSLAQALTRIWPQLLAARDVRWPQQVFTRGDWDKLVTWDGKLRRNST